MKSSKQKIEKFNKFEEILKENLNCSVHIDKDFKEDLKTKLLEKSISNLSEQSKMDEKKKVRINFLPKLGIGLLVFLALAGIGTLTYLGLTGKINFGKESRFANNSENNAETIAKLYIIEGDVTLVRDGNTSTSNSEVSLKAGDEITTSENSIVDITGDFGRLALDSSTKIVINEMNGSPYPYVKDGTVFISSSTNYDKVIYAKTANAEITLKEGSTIISQNGEINTTSQGLFPKFLNLISSPAYASNNDQSTKVLNINGEITVTASNKEVKLVKGQEIVIENRTALDPVLTSKDSLKTDFYTKIAEKEINEGKDLGIGADLIAPVVNIISPANGSTVTNKNIYIKFTSNEDGWFLNENPWREISANAENNYNLNLNEGENKIELTVKDKAYNRTIVSLTINYQPEASNPVTPPVVNPPVNPVEGSITLSGSAYEGGVNLNWSVTNLSTEHGFKVVYSTNANPVYPGNEYQYLSNPDQRSTTWNLPAGTYHFRVCKYNGAGTCLLYSNDITLTVQQATPVSIVLSATQVANGISLNWSVTGTSSKGFKVVKSENPNPVYPGDDYLYFPDPNTRSTIWDLTDGKTYHFRVCEYLGGTCGVYSNDVVIQAPVK